MHGCALVDDEGHACLAPLAPLNTTGRVCAMGLDMALKTFALRELPGWLCLPVSLKTHACGADCCSDETSFSSWIWNLYAHAIAVG
jgi:hypothetical protein